MRIFALSLLLLIPPMGVAAQVPAATTPAAAAQKPATPGSKIAIVDFAMLLQESDAGKTAQIEYEKKIAPEKAKFEKVGKEMDDLQTKLRNAKTDAETAAVSREIEAKKVEGQRVQEDAQKAADDTQRQLLPPVAELAQKAVKKYSEDNELAVVIDPNTDPNNVVFAAKASDITAEVLRIMNAEFAKNPKPVAEMAVPAVPKAGATPPK